MVVSELVIAAEEALSDITLWAPSGDMSILAQGTLNCIRAIGGYTVAGTPETAFDTEGFNEAEYLVQLESVEQLRVAMNWYNSFKVVGLYCLGFLEEAAKLGFYVYETRDTNPK